MYLMPFVHGLLYFTADERPPLVGHRRLPLNLFLQEHQRVKKHLGTGRASGYEDIDRNDLINTLADTVDVEHPS